PSLIRGDAGALDRPAAHPLEKAAAVLADLEAWHLVAAAGVLDPADASRHREAALEARWERLRRLHAAFTAAGDRRQIRGALQADLLAARELPWWSMGMATLADFERGVSAAGAHATALAGAAAFPGSPGALRCLSIARAIESPEYRLSGMQEDGI